jgi:MOSC domain-containing protein YiiM
MKIIAVSLSKPVEIEHNGELIKTSIFKTPVSGRVLATYTGLEGDGPADLVAHGGADKAIYVYSIDHYRYWESELGWSGMPYGQFGENLTVEGLRDDEVHIGDRFRFGQAICEVTQPRIPCFKLGIRMSSPRFPKQFLRSQRVGFYVRVLKQATLGSGDPIAKIAEHPGRLSVAESLLALTKGPKQFEVIRRALAIEALSAAWREDLGSRLEQGT